MKTLFLSVLLLSVSSLAQAAQNATATPITFLLVTSAGGVEVGIQASTVTGTKPSCANYSDRYMFDGTTTQGQLMYRILLGAQLAGLKVTINGVGSCPYTSDVEGPDRIYINASEN